MLTCPATDTEYPCLTNSCNPADNASQVTPELNFSLMANAMLVGTGGRLAFQDILLSDFAHVTMYQYTPSQPYRNMGVGWPLWPTVAMAPGSRVRPQLDLQVRGTIIVSVSQQCGRTALGIIGW